jgi:hypothetical protein
MTLSDLSDLGTFISAVAVVASLIFVGVQLKQNTRAVRAAASQAHTAHWQAMLTPVIENEGVADIYRRGLCGMESLTDNDCVRFIVLIGAMFRFAESARLQWVHGQLEDAHWLNMERNFIALASQPGFRGYWALRREWYAPDFQAWYEALPVHTAGSMYKPQQGA